MERLVGERREPGREGERGEAEGERAVLPDEPRRRALARDDGEGRERADPEEERPVVGVEHEREDEREDADVAPAAQDEGVGEGAPSRGC